MRAWLFLLGLWAGLGCAGGSALRAQEDPENAVNRILSDPSYQRALPDAGALRDGARDPREKSASGRRESDDGAPSRGLDLTEGGPEVLRVLLLVLIGALAVFVLMKIALAVRDARARADAERPIARKAAVSGSLPAAASEVARSRARELAAEGRYAEALHELLLELLRELAPHAAPGRTSRELVREIALRDGERRAVESFARSVERAIFAGESSSADAWRSGLESFEALRAKGRAR